MSIIPGVSNAPIIASVAQATSTLSNGIASSILVFGVQLNPTSAGNAFVQYKLYRGVTAAGPFNHVCDDSFLSPITLTTQLYDLAPNFGVTRYYVATGLTASGFESAQSAVIYYTASNQILGPIVAAPISAAAFGPYPVLGSDCYLDPTTREGVIGPNGDLLAVNSLECLAQDLRIHALTEFGELPMHQTFGLQKGRVIGSGQAGRKTQAMIFMANFKDMLRSEPRVYQIINVQVYEYDAYSWIVGYDVMAIDVEDSLQLNFVYPFVNQ